MTRIPPKMGGVFRSYVFPSSMTIKITSVPKFEKALLFFLHNDHPLKWLPPNHVSMKSRKHSHAFRFLRRKSVDALIAPPFPLPSKRTSVKVICRPKHLYPLPIPIFAALVMLESVNLPKQTNRAVVPFQWKSIVHACSRLSCPKNSPLPLPMKRRRANTCASHRLSARRTEKREA